MAYWKRLAGTGTSVLYDMTRDEGQEVNVYGDPNYAEVITKTR